MKKKKTFKPSATAGHIEPMENDVTKKPGAARKEAIFKLSQYLKDNGLDPEKSWDKDPIHGPVVEELYHIIRIAEQKIRTKVVKLHKPIVHPTVREVRGPVAKYDYPDIEGKPMSRQMKRKYRMKMRALLKANMDVKAAAKKAVEFAERWDNSDNPDETIRRRKSPKTGLSATVPLKRDQRKREKEPKKNSGN